MGPPGCKRAPDRGRSRRRWRRSCRSSTGGRHTWGSKRRETRERMNNSRAQERLTNSLPEQLQLLPRPPQLLMRRRVFCGLLRQRHCKLLELHLKRRERRTSDLGSCSKGRDYSKLSHACRSECCPTRKPGWGVGTTMKSACGGGGVIGLGWGRIDGVGGNTRHAKPTRMQRSGTIQGRSLDMPQSFARRSGDASAEAPAPTAARVFIECVGSRGASSAFTRCAAHRGAWQVRGSCIRHSTGLGHPGRKTGAARSRSSCIRHSTALFPPGRRTGAARGL